MSEDIRQALLALDLLKRYVLTDEPEYVGFERAAIETVKVALEAAQQEAEARSAVAQWCKHKLRECRYARSGWHHLTLGVPGVVGGTMFQGPDFGKVLIDAGKWCHAELAK